MDDHLACAVAGITADANILINYARLAAQRYTLTYQEPIPVEQLIINICDRKQGYTQFGGLRPFGVSFLWAGWDKNFGFQLYQSDPSGNYGGWKATAIGANNQAAQSILKQEYKNGMELGDVVKLAIKVLNKSMDSTSLTSEKCKIAFMLHACSCFISFLLLSPVLFVRCRADAALQPYACCRCMNTFLYLLGVAFTLFSERASVMQWSWQLCQWLMASWSTRFSTMRPWTLLSRSLTWPSLRQRARDTFRISGIMAACCCRRQSYEWWQRNGSDNHLDSLGFLHLGCVVISSVRR